MKKAQMEEIINLIRHKDSHADIFDLMLNLNMTMDDFHEYSFQLCPGTQVPSSSANCTKLNSYFLPRHEVLTFCTSLSVKLHSYKASLWSK